jgi:hypothetical protein
MQPLLQPRRIPVYVPRLSLVQRFWFRDEMVHTIQGGDLFIAAMGWAGLDWGVLPLPRKEGD